MTGMLYGEYVGCESGIEACAAESKRALTALYESGINYDGFVYPYFDSLLMRKDTEKYGILFGTHSLIWDADGRVSSEDFSALGFDYGRIAAFLSEGLYSPQGNEYLLGGFEYLIEGAVQPWAIRECSRKFCSFCEHIARMDGIDVLGLTGGYVVARIDDENLLEEISRIYGSKTDGLCRIRRS